MDYRLVGKRITLRGTQIIRCEPKEKLSFEELVNLLTLNPWHFQLLTNYILEFLGGTQELALKLNLIAAGPKNIDIFTDLLGISDIDLFIAISLIEFYNFHVNNWISGSLNTSDPRFQYLSPFLRRAYDPDLQYSNELYLLLKGLEQEDGFLNPEKMGTLTVQLKNKILELCRNLISNQPEQNYTPIKTFVENPSKKKDHYYFTSLREVPVQETINRIKGGKILAKIGVNENTIIGPNYKFGTFHYRLMRNFDLNIKDLNISVYEQSGANGKGTSEDLAWASMAAEAIERFSAAMGIPDWPRCYKEDLDFTFSRLSDLIKHGIHEDFRVLDPNELNLVSPYQNEETYWVKGIDLEGNAIYVLAEAVFIPYIRNSPIYRIGTSNGLASGNTLNEAKLHAYGEIIERDSESRSFGIGDYKILKPQKIPEINRILEEYVKEQLVVYVRDATMELGIPTYLVYLATKDGINLSACGTSLDGVEALIRALAELNPDIQSALEKDNLIRGIPEYLESCPELDVELLPNYSTGNVKEDVILLEKVFHENNFSPIYFDLTVKSIHFSVVRIIIPGWSPNYFYFNNHRYFRTLFHALSLNQKPTPQGKLKKRNQ